MKKTIRDFELNDKKVLIRVDFNVPIKDGVIADDNRIVEALPTIRYALEKGGKVILFSHLGRVKEEADLAKNDLRIVSSRLSELLNKDVIFVNKTRGIELEDAISHLTSGDVLLVQNTRYEDLDGKKESSNDLELGKYWASLGDIFINDAFGTAHRAHASNVGIASHLPNGVGFLMEKEIDIIGKALEHPEHPFIVILGGSKISDKIGVINNLLNKADNILIGGGMAYTFIKALNYNVGKSIVDEDNLEFARKMIEQHDQEIVIPVDSITGLEISENTVISTKDNGDIADNEIGLDIGPNTIRLFEKYIAMAKTIIWNGPMGVVEISHFQKGTLSLLKAIEKVEGTTIVGGGDTAAYVINAGYREAFTHISTGGGASLEMLEGKVLPGVECIDEK